MSRNWSLLQSGFFTEVLSGVARRKELKAQRGQCMAYLLRARAGTGKTTTAVELILRLKRANPRLRILFTVFANRNRADMERKMAEAGLGTLVKKKGWGKGAARVEFVSNGDGCIEIRTMNSLGLRSLSQAWGKVQTVTGHTIDRRIADPHLPPTGRGEGEMSIKDRKGVEKLINGAMAFLASADDELALVMQNEDLGIEWDTLKWPTAMIFPAVRAILAGYRRPQAQVSFAHQIYVPAVEGYRHGNFDVVVVDEGQDQSPAKMKLCQLALADDGVMVMVGDDAQAIFGFAGADARSVQNYIEKWNPKVMPLSITYRCPKVIVESVKHIVPDYEAHESAADGEIIESNVDQMHSLWKAGDVCISATNAPTVKHCLAAWRQGKKAMVLGKDFAEELKKLIKRSESSTVLSFLSWLTEYVDQEVARLLASKRNDAIEKLEDIQETLITLTEGLSMMSQVEARMEQVFADDPKEGCILLTSTHKFKGGEAAVVWMFSDTYKPTGRHYEVGDEIAASDCLWYVARTRVMAVKGDPESGKLYLVPVKEKKAKKGAVTAEVGNDGDVSLPPIKIEPATIIRDVPQLPAPVTAKVAPAPAPVSRKLPSVAAKPVAAPTVTVRKKLSPEEQKAAMARLLAK